MLKIAIIEDEQAASTLLESYLDRFTQEKGARFDVRVFRDAVAFLTEYRPDFDIVFMDIELPHLNGTEAAKCLREMDPVVALVFITNMAQYAIRGYEVDAVDFVLKPVSYYRFSSLLQKILRRMGERADLELTIRTPGGLQRVLASRIIYLSVEDHLLLYHTEDGVIEAWGTLKSSRDSLAEGTFVQVNKSCVVNLKHVRAIKGDKILVGETELTLSRGRKADVIRTLNHFLER